MRFKYLPHTADIKFKAFGKNLEETFANCVYALQDSLVKGKVKEKIKKKIEVSGSDLGSLLYNFLEEFLFLFDSEQFLVSKVKEIKIDKKKFKLKAKVVGDSAENYEIKTHIKAMTYSDLDIQQKKGEVEIVLVLDV
jgi:SHS2 domain-containing protein